MPPTAHTPSSWDAAENWPPSCSRNGPTAAHSLDTRQGCARRHRQPACRVLVISSFSLDRVARRLFGQGKFIADGSDKIEDPPPVPERIDLLAAYNLEDCRLVEAIFAKTDLVNFCLQRARMTGLPLGRQGGSVAAFDNLYLPRFTGPAQSHWIQVHAVLTRPVRVVMQWIRSRVCMTMFGTRLQESLSQHHSHHRIDPLGMGVPGQDPVPRFSQCTILARRASCQR